MHAIADVTALRVVLDHSEASSIDALRRENSKLRTELAQTAARALKVGQLYELPARSLQQHCPLFQFPDMNCVPLRYEGYDWLSLPCTLTQTDGVGHTTMRRTQRIVPMGRNGPTPGSTRVHAFTTGYSTKHPCLVDAEAKLGPLIRIGVAPEQLHTLLAFDFVAKDDGTRSAPTRYVNERGEVTLCFWSGRARREPGGEGGGHRDVQC